MNLKNLLIVLLEFMNLWFIEIIVILRANFSPLFFNLSQLVDSLEFCVILFLLNCFLKEFLFFIIFSSVEFILFNINILNIFLATFLDFTFKF